MWVDGREGVWVCEWLSHNCMVHYSELSTCAHWVGGYSLLGHCWLVSVTLMNITRVQPDTPPHSWVGAGKTHAWMVNFWSHVSRHLELLCSRAHHTLGIMASMVALPSWADTRSTNLTAKNSNTCGNWFFIMHSVQLCIQPRKMETKLSTQQLKS